MNCNDVKPGLCVTVAKLGSTDGMTIAPKHLAVRRVGTVGTVSGYVPGHGGDVWWVKHSGSEDVGAYCFDEIEPVVPHLWLPISSATRDGTWVLLGGPSGYGTTALRCEVCRYDPEYRPLSPWQNHANNAFTDGGSAPTCWMPLPANGEEFAK